MNVCTICDDYTLIVHNFTYIHTYCTYIYLSLHTYIHTMYTNEIKVSFWMTRPGKTGQRLISPLGLGSSASLPLLAHLCCMHTLDGVFPVFIFTHFRNSILLSLSEIPLLYAERPQVSLDFSSLEQICPRTLFMTL